MTLIAVLFAALLVFGFVSLIVARWQMRATMAQVDLLRHEIELTRSALGATEKAASAAAVCARTVEQALQLAQAATLQIEAVHLLPDGALDRNAVVAIVLTNSGQTRAVECAHDLVVGHPNRQGSEHSTDAMPSVLGPGRRVEVRFGPVREFINDEALKHVLSGGMPLHFWGDVTYRDVFGGDHRIRCGGTYNHESNGFVVDQSEVSAIKADSKPREGP